MNGTALLDTTDRHDETMVTASDLVRHFGIWQERAVRAPVYVLHRGRPRLVLTSIDVMDALCAPHSSDSAAEAADAAIVLDLVSDIVVLLNGELRITAASRSARAYFGDIVSIGGSADAIGAAPARSFLAATILRVAGSGLAETLELPSARLPARRLSIAIQPYPAGIALIAHDVTIQSDLRAALAQRSATAEAIGTLEGVADVVINLRGHIDHPGAALATLSGLPAEALSSVRFVTLVEIGCRVAVAEAIEGVIADGVARAVTATLLVNRAQPRPVRIGLSALRCGSIVEAVLAMIVSAPTH